MARITLSSHWKFQRLARALGSKVLARGILETLWEPAWIAGDAYCGTSQDIEALCEWKGAPGALTKELLMSTSKTAGFIEPFAGRLRDTKEPHYQIHDFLEHCPEYVRRRHDQKSTTNARTCVVCGDEFLSAREGRYCSSRCRQASFRGTKRDGVTADVTRKRYAEPLRGTDRTDRNGSRNANVTDSNGCVTDSNGSVTAAVTAPVTQPLRADENPEQNTPVTAERNALRNGSNGCNAPLLYSTVRYVPVLATVALRATAPPTTDPPGLELDDDADAESPPSPPPRAATPPPPPPKAPRAPRKAKAATMVVDASPVVLTFQTVGDPASWDLHQSQVATWQAAYPALDVLGEARRALVWIEADSARRKTAGGMRKCLVAWLNRTTDSTRGRGGPTTITGSLKTAGNQAAVASWLRKHNALD